MRGPWGRADRKVLRRGAAMNDNGRAVKLYVVLAAAVIVVLNLLLLFNWSEFIKGLL